MPKTPARHWLLPVIFSMVLLSACSAIDFNPPPLPATLPAVGASETPILLPAPATETPVPLPATETATALPVTPSPTGVELRLGSPAMFGELDGWSWGWLGEQQVLLRTTDGGQSWQDVTPPSEMTLWPGFFLNANNAWLTSFNADSHLVIFQTADGGQTWQQFPASGLNDLSGQPFLTFSSATEGILEANSVGAGNRFIQVYETHDGGRSFEVVSMQPLDGQGFPNTIRVCSICADAFAYSPSLVMIVNGDLGSMEPMGRVSLITSADKGLTWEPQTLPLPAQYADMLVVPQPLQFFGPNDGVIPLILRRYANNNLTANIFVLYITHDAGKSWELAPASLDTPPGASPQFLSPSEIIIACGETVCFSRDGAQTWQPASGKLPSNPPAEPQSLTFTDFQHGWYVLATETSSSLYRTTDGGQNWVLLNP
jgi:photosystem II stability/assembly factor-like uncharacterized protein